MIIEENNGNEEIEIYERTLSSYEPDVYISQNGCGEVRLDKQQATQLIEVLTKWVNGGEVE